MDMAVGGKDAVALREVVSTGIVGDTTTGLADDERSGHEVPGTDVALGIAVQSACSNPAEGKGGRTYHTDTGHTTIKVADEPLYDRLIGVAVVGQLKTEKGIVQYTGADTQGLWGAEGTRKIALKPRSTTRPGIETLRGGDIVNDTKKDAVALNEGDADGIRGITVDEVGGAIERINDPSGEFRVESSKVESGAFFSEEGGGGDEGTQSLNKELLGGLIDIRHIVVSVLALDTLVRETLALLTDVRTRLVSYLAHQAG